MNYPFEQALNLWPTPPTNPLEALRHTLDIYDGQVSDSGYVCIATSNVYGHGIRTGLTWGDLRNIAALIEEKS